MSIITQPERICGLWFPACNAHAPLPSMACPPLQYFYTLSHKGQDFLKKKVSEHNTRVLIFSTTLETSLILRNEQDKIKMYTGLQVKYPLFLSDFNLLAPELF